MYSMTSSKRAAVSRKEKNHYHVGHIEREILRAAIPARGANQCTWHWAHLIPRLSCYSFRSDPSKVFWGTGWKNPPDETDEWLCLSGPAVVESRVIQRRQPIMSFILTVQQEFFGEFREREGGSGCREGLLQEQRRSLCGSGAKAAGPVQCPNIPHPRIDSSGLWTRQRPETENNQPCASPQLTQSTLIRPHVDPILLRSSFFAPPLTIDPV